MIKEFFKKAGKKLKRITGSNKKHDKSGALSGQDLQEDQEKNPVPSADQDIARDNQDTIDLEQGG